MLPGSVPSQNLPGQTFTPKQDRKLPLKRHITVKLIPKRTKKTLLSIISYLTLNLIMKNLWQKMLEWKLTTLFLNYWTMTIRCISY